MDCEADETPAATSDAHEARRQYLQAHDLHGLFLQAVDSAMQQNAHKPAEFVGREILRLASSRELMSSGPVL